MNPQRITFAKVGKQTLHLVGTFLEVISRRGVRVPRDFVCYDVPYNWDLYYKPWKVVPLWGEDIIFSTGENEFAWAEENGKVCLAHFAEHPVTSEMVPVLQVTREGPLSTYVTLTAKVTDPVAFVRDPVLGLIHEGSEGYPKIEKPRTVRVTVHKSPGKMYHSTIEEAPDHPTTSTRFLVEDGVSSEFYPHILSALVSAMTPEDIKAFQEWKREVVDATQPKP